MKHPFVYLEGIELGLGEADDIVIKNCIAYNCLPMGHPDIRVLTEMEDWDHEFEQQTGKCVTEVE